MMKENIQKITRQIQESAQHNGLNAKNITLVAVSKFHSIESIQEAYNYGLRDFGENYLQEWQKKCAELSDLKDIRWHLIGPLQKNKAKYLNEHIFCFQALDSLELAKEIEKRWNFSKPLQVLIQLKIDENDKNKSGISYEEASNLVSYVQQSSKLKLLGFMGIGPIVENKVDLKPLYEEFVAQSKKFVPDKNIVLSFGMSDDLDVALSCGSNMVRVGTAIFGSRPPSHS
jgi:pyridoxal phosphate enzyme (YggS family)